MNFEQFIEFDKVKVENNIKIVEKLLESVLWYMNLVKCLTIIVLAKKYFHNVI